MKPRQLARSGYAMSVLSTWSSIDRFELGNALYAAGRRRLCFGPEMQAGFQPFVAVTSYFANGNLVTMDPSRTLVYPNKYPLRPKGTRYERSGEVERFEQGNITGRQTMVKCGVG
jgi:hypothetical protein